MNEEIIDAEKLARIIEKPLDTGIVLNLESHIQNPCGTIVGDEIRDIREFYIREAERILPTLTNPHAADYLARIIEKYR